MTAGEAQELRYLRGRFAAISAIIVQHEVEEMVVIFAMPFGHARQLRRGLFQLRESSQARIR